MNVAVKAFNAYVDYVIKINNVHTVLSLMLRNSFLNETLVNKSERKFSKTKHLFLAIYLYFPIYFNVTRTVQLSLDIKATPFNSLRTLS